MKIRLTLPKEPIRLEFDGLPYPLWMLVRPPSSPLDEASKVKAAEAGKKMADHIDAIVSAGGDVSGLMDISDPAAVQGQAITAYAIALAELAVLDWGGAAVEDPATGQVVPPEPAVIAELMRWPGLPGQFIGKYLAPLSRAVTEGNGLGAVSPGT